MASKPKCPRRWRMTRSARLQSARLWVKQFGPGPHGRGLVHRYSKWFRTDLGCAVVELQKLETALEPGYVDQLRVTLQYHRVVKKQAPAPSEMPAGYGELWDDQFSFIAGHTASGAPFGTTWDEMDNQSGPSPAAPVLPSEADRDVHGDNDKIPF